jgi:hypothetical protein
MIPTRRLEALLDDPLVKEVVEAIEQRLPWGVRPRQLKVRTLLLGMLLVGVDHRPAHLSRVHSALLGLGAEDRLRLGVLVDSRKGPHLLTYRQVEYTARLVYSALGKDRPDGAGSALLEGLQGSRASRGHRPKEAASVPIPRLPGGAVTRRSRARKTSSSSVTTSRSRRWSTTRTKMPSPSSSGPWRSAHVI